MYPVMKWLASGWTLLLLGASPTPVLAAALASEGGLNLLVVAENAAASNFQPSQIDRVARIVMSKLTENGHTVFDGNSFPGHGARHANPATTNPGTNIAKPASRAPSAPLDAVIMVSANVILKTGVYVSHLEVRTRARLVDGRGGQHIALITLAPYRSRRLPSQCRQSCLRDLAAKLVEARSSHLGAEIARRLATWSPTRPPRKIAPTIASIPAAKPPSAGYELTFRGIDPRDVAEIETYLVVFRGYRGLDRIKNGAAWRYRSSLDQAELERSLRKMLRLMGIGARITSIGRSIVIDGAGSKPAPNATSKDW